ncbi:hypothetical protein HanIR_Chr08g0364451 [Helianthus annuus]|nr:hypothetical protein HanIR_Chr08g0364451 [Helianthus annuus]
MEEYKDKIEGKVKPKYYGDLTRYPDRHPSSSFRQVFDSGDLLTSTVSGEKASVGEWKSRKTR